MNLDHACHMQLAAEDPSKAFGPRGVPIVIAGVHCRTWRDCGYWHIETPAGIQSFREDICNFVDARHCVAEFLEAIRAD